MRRRARAPPGSGDLLTLFVVHNVRCGWCWHAHCRWVYSRALPSWLAPGVTVRHDQRAAPFPGAVARRRRWVRVRRLRAVAPPPPRRVGDGDDDRRRRAEPEANGDDAAAPRPAADGDPRAGDADA